MNLVLFILVCATPLSVGFTQGVPQTRGQPWPMPSSYQPSGTTQTLNQFNFQFQVAGSDCDILRSALDRYFNIIFYPGSLSQESRKRIDERVKFQLKKTYSGSVLEVLSVNVQQPCSSSDYPSLDMDESYTLNVGASSKLSAPSIWGALRGLETFSQLVYQGDMGDLYINNTMIQDKPRFSWRGVLLDTSRHYLPKEIIMQNLEAMAYNKLNVFHWHIVDDQSFPYQSMRFPDLSNKGAYDPYTHIYTQQDVKEIIEFARLRGIRVVPEFDSPGHSQSWGKGQAGLLAKCYDKQGHPTGGFGPIDPTLNTTYPFLKSFMGELHNVFPDKYLHLGGDEVSFSCWQSNPDIKKFMVKMGYGTDYAKLEAYYMQNLLDIVGSFGNGYIVWQEVIDNGVKVKPDTVAHVWKSTGKEVAMVTKKGLHTLYSTCWYLNEISYGVDWKKYYACDPQKFDGTAAQKKLVIGGELCMWGEYVDATNVISRTWPRGGAVAERLWSSATLTDANKALPRLEEHRCRMVRRGLNAEPVNGPGHCIYEYAPRV